MEKLNIAKKIIYKHLCDRAQISQKLIPGEKIGIKIDQTLTQDATGTLVYLELESLNIDKIKTELSVSYVDHNTLQLGFENSDDHKFLKSVASKYGIIFSPPGNGICHQLHLENFSQPGKTLLGSDSHTPTCGAVGMLAIGAGGLDVACALAGEAFYFTMPEIINIILNGKLHPATSAKDVILELLKRLSVKGGYNKIFEFTGNGIKNLDVYDRATICNMGSELGLTTSLFPSDEITMNFFEINKRKYMWEKLLPDKNADYDSTIKINLDDIEPLIACPHSPDNVVKVKEIKNQKIDQVCIGSCTNSSYNDLMLIADILKYNKIHHNVELIISPGSKQILSLLAENGSLKTILDSGARILEPSCGPCIGMGQAPLSNGVSLRTFNRNFKGRCGTPNADVYLCSTETAIVSAIYGKITDPRKLIKKQKKYSYKIKSKSDIFIYPPKQILRKNIIVYKGPNIKPLPEFTKLPNNIYGKVYLKLGDNISTDDILPAGAKILPLRSNIPAIADYTFSRIDSSFVRRIKEDRLKNKGKTGIIIAGENYGQGSSREHASIVLRYLGIQIIIAKSFARIHLANLINFGILPLIFANPNDYEFITQNSELKFSDIHKILNINQHFKIITSKRLINLKYYLDNKEKQIILKGGLLNFICNK